MEAPRPYDWENYKAVSERVIDFASGLKKLGLGRGSKVGIYAGNRAEWLITDLACMMLSIVSVPLYDSLGTDAVRYIINHAALPVVVCGNDKTNSLLAMTSVTGDCASLKILVEIGPTVHHEVSASVREYSQRVGMEVFAFGEVEKEGATARVHPDPPAPSDLFTIMYTSGTTGVPKGVMVTHKSFIASLTGILRQGVIVPTHEDVHLSYLPLAHVFERGIVHILLLQGAQIAFAWGDFAKLPDDLLEIRPTIFIGVPRVFNRLYDKIQQGVEGSGWFSRMLFNMGLSSKTDAQKQGSDTPVWNSLIFSETAQKVGGRVRLIVSGGAPLSAQVQEFLRACFCCPVLQVYGLTEVGAITFATLGDTDCGHVGPPVPSSEVKLVDVPDLGYTSRDLPLQRGEVCCRGPSVFAGYYLDKEATAEAVDRDGWFHTGDIGQWNLNGTLSVIDRKKNLLKLSQGEYVSPETIETALATNRFVSQIFVHGDSLHDNLVAVIVADPDVTRAHAKQQGLTDPDDFPALVKNPAVQGVIRAELDALAKEAKLKGYEVPKAYHYVSEPFTIQNGLITPTYKLKRQALVAAYKRNIEEMYLEVLIEKKKKEAMGGGK